MADIPITPGTGGSSVATELVEARNFQLVEIYGQGGASVLGINPDRSISVSVIGTPAVTLSGSPSISGAVFISGSVLAQQTGTVISSIVNSIPSSVLVGASIFGALPGGNAVLGGVAASISGTVTITQSGTVISSMVSSIPSSVLVGASIFGQLPAGTAPLGSIATLQGTNPWVTINVGSIITTQIGSVITTNVGSVITVFQNSSILAVPVGSIITVLQTSSILSVPIGSTIAVLQAPSIVGTYAEDSGHTSGDKGIFGLNVRNDTLSSITNADLDYSPMAVGPTGEVIVANSPITKWVQGTASILGGVPLTGGSVAIIAAQGASIFTYITGIQIVNAGATTQWLRFDGGTSSVIGFTIAPAGGGSNITLPNTWKTNANSAFTASISGAGSGASVYLSAQGFISKT